MILNLASCLAIPAGVLDGQSLQEWPRVFVHRDHRPPLISIISSPHRRSQTEFLLFFGCLLELAQPSLEDLKWIFCVWNVLRNVKNGSIIFLGYYPPSQSAEYGALHLVTA